MYYLAKGVVPLLALIFFSALVISILALILALQNTATVTITFLNWTMQGPLALALLVAMALGALVSILLLLPTIIRDRWTIASQRKKLANLEARMAESSQKPTATQTNSECQEKPLS